MADVEEKQVILKVNLVDEGSAKNLATLTSGLDDLKASKKALDTTTEKGRVQNEQYTIAISAQRKAINEARKELQNSIKENRSAVGSYNKLSAQYDLNKTKLNAMSDADRKGTEAGRKLEVQTAAMYEAMKQLQESTGKHTLSVGDYEKATKSLNVEIKEMTTQLYAMAQAGGENSEEYKKLLVETQKLVVDQKKVEATYNQVNTAIQQNLNITEEATQATGDYEKNQKSLNEQLSESPGVLGSATQGANTLGAAFKRLIANPIVLVITLLVGALTGLVAIFKQTKVGAELFAVAGAAIDGVFSVIIGLVDKLAIGLKSVFDDPLGSLKAFGKAILDNIVNRFTAVIDLGSSVGRMLSSLFKGDLKGLKVAAGDAGKALIQMNTGLDVEQQEKFGKAIKKATKEVIAQTNAFADLERQRIAVRQSNRELSKSLEELKTKQQEYSIIAEDDTRSWVERGQAAKLALATTEEIAQKELKIAKDNLNIINKDIQMREANGQLVEDLKDQQLAAFKALADADRNYRTTVADRAEKDALRERDLIEKNLDALQKDLETRRGILLEGVGDEDLSFKDRAKNLSELRKLQDESFADQLIEIQKLTDVQINANDLLQASNSQLLLEKIRELGLSEIGEQRLIEMVADRKTAVNDLSTSYKELAASQVDGVKELLQLNTDEQIEEVTKKYQDAINSLNDVEAPDRGLFATDEEYKLAMDKYSEFMLEKELIARRLTKQLNDEVTAIEQDARDKRTKAKEKADTDAIAKEREKYDEMANIISEWGSVATEALSALSNLADALNEKELANLEEKYNRETELLDKKLEDGIISQEEYDNKVGTLDKKLAKEQAKMAREMAIREKAMSVFSIGLNTAVAIMKTIAELGPVVGLPASIAIGALGAIQLAAVIAQPLPKAEKGMYIQGASHTNGGVAIEAEGGEVIMSKGAVGLFGSTLSAMNVAGGGIPFNIPDGGYAIRNAHGQPDLNAITSRLDALLSQKIYLTVEDYRRANSSYANVVDKGNI